MSLKIKIIKLYNDDSSLAWYVPKSNKVVLKENSKPNMENKFFFIHQKLIELNWIN